jgi:hypothetical protein
MLGLQVLRRAHDFLVSGPKDGSLGPVTKHVEALGQSMDRLGAHAVDQDESGRAFRGNARRAKKIARSLRMNLMRPLARMAQTLFPDEPDVRQALSLQKARGYEHLIAAALAMAGQAAERKDRFIAAGLADDFVDRLRNSAADLRAALDEKGTHYGKRSAATAGMLDEMARGKDLIRLLDDMVTPVLEKTPDRLAEWRTMSRFVRIAKVEEAGGILPGGEPNATPGATPAAPPVVTPATPVPAAHEGVTVDRAA